jgi:hypothetical protein
MLLAVNRALDTKLLAVMMSLHARLGAERSLGVLDDHVVTLICDLLLPGNQALSLLGKAGWLLQLLLAKLLNWRVMMR